MSNHVISIKVPECATLPLSAQGSVTIVYKEENLHLEPGDEDGIYYVVNDYDDMETDLENCTLKDAIFSLISFAFLGVKLKGPDSKGKSFSGDGDTLRIADWQREKIIQAILSDNDIVMEP